MSDYQDYLQSNHWKRLAEETKRLAGYRCQVCNAEDELHAHHRTYERKGDELQSDLICLCAYCHALFHSKKLEDIKQVRQHAEERIQGILHTHAMDVDYLKKELRAREEVITALLKENKNHPVPDIVIK